MKVSVYLKLRYKFFTFMTLPRQTEGLQTTSRQTNFHRRQHIFNIIKRLWYSTKKNRTTVLKMIVTLSYKETPQMCVRTETAGRQHCDDAPTRCWLFRSKIFPTFLTDAMIRTDNTHEWKKTAPSSAGWCSPPIGKYQSYVLGGNLAGHYRSVSRAER